MRELADLNPGVSIDEWEPDSARMRQLVLLMHNALFAIPAFSDGLYRLPKVAFWDFVCGAPRSIQFEALGNARRVARHVAIAISSSDAWGKMLRDRELPAAEALKRAADEK